MLTVIRVELAKRGWRQRDLARKMGVSDSLVSRIMSGDRTLTGPLARKMEKALRLKKGTLAND